tara:strand:+ start:192 stop:1271 length:1080 start_codon:yes stop_codon:yes gene_type:complete
MKIYNFIFHSKNLYIFFIIVSLTNFFFSTAKVEAKAFDIVDIEISKPFKIDFDKRDIIDEGFKIAFSKLANLIAKSSDQKKLNEIKLNEIKGMIESFSIKEEKFIDQVYYVNLGVSFNKKKVFDYFEKKNIFPSLPSKKKFLFIPIIIDENAKDLLIFSDNKFFEKWNEKKETYQLLEYILPTEDLEDFNLIKKRYEFIEEYDFKEITDKYNLKDSIIALIFKNEQGIRVLSRIKSKNDLVLKNQSFKNVNINDDDQIINLINSLKEIYEDYWKDFNLINTSIKFQLMIKIDSSDNQKISKFEKILSETDLIYDYSISKFDRNYLIYEIIFNGTPDLFLKLMSEKNKEFDTQNRIWKLK